MSLRLLYLIFLQLVNLLVLLGRSSVSKDAELRVLCHELAVLRHELAVLRRVNSKPRLDWADPPTGFQMHVLPADSRLQYICNMHGTCGGLRDCDARLVRRPA